MFRSLIPAAGILGMFSVVFAESVEIRILNPDGTPIRNARSVEIQHRAGARVLDDLTPLPVFDQTGQRQGTPIRSLEIADGTVKFELTAQAVVASSDAGFLFLPNPGREPNAARQARLLPWASLLVDSSAFPEPLRSRYQLRLTWTNSFAGAYLRPSKNTELDWRFHPYLSWERIIDLSNQAVRVPPGEVVVSVVDKELVERINGTNPGPLKPSHFVTLGVWKAASGQETRVTLPQFGSLQGTIRQPQNTLPNWGQRTTPVRHISMSPQSTPELLKKAQAMLNGNTFSLFVQQKSAADQRAALNEYAAWLSSEEGFELRRTAVSTNAPISADGSFEIPLVPEGVFVIRQVARNDSQATTSGGGYRSELLQLPGPHGTSQVSVNAGEVRDLGMLTPLAASEVARSSAYSPTKTPWAQPAIPLGQPGPPQFPGASSPAPNSWTPGPGVTGYLVVCQVDDRQPSEVAAELGSAVSEGC